MSCWDVLCECGEPARVARYVTSYHAIRRAETHADLQKECMEWLTKLVWCCIVELFVVLKDKLFVWVVITKLNYLLLIYFVCVWSSCLCLERICCLCENACCILARLLELRARAKFTAAAGTSAPRHANAGDRRAANWFLAPRELGGCWRCS